MEKAQIGKAQHFVLELHPPGFGTLNEDGENVGGYRREKYVHYLRGGLDRKWVGPYCLTQSKSNPEYSGGAPAPNAVGVSIKRLDPYQPETIPDDRDHEVNKELRRLSRALRALSGCNQALAQASSEQQLLNQICEIIVRVGGYRMAGIAYAQHDEERTVRPVAHAGYDSGYLETIGLRWSDTPPGHGPIGTAIRESRICMCTDTANNPAFAPWREAALQRGYAAVISFPLRSAGKAFGALAIYSEQANAFEKSEIELLSEMANNLAFGITALRSQDESRRATAALQEAERKYRQLVEQVPAISYVAETGAFGPFLYMSPQVKTILGYDPENCIADSRFWWEHLNPEDQPRALLEDTWEEGRLFQIEYRMRRNDGEEVWVRDEAIIVRDPMTGKKLTRGLLIDVATSRGGQRLEPGDVITVADAEKALASTGHDVRPGDAVFFHTGWGGLWGADNERYAAGEPGPGLALAQWLADHRVALTGCDTWSFGPYPPESHCEPFVVPQVLNVRHGVVVVENLRLDEAARDRVHEFLLVISHAKLRGATGAWVAPLAIG